MKIVSLKSKKKEYTVSVCVSDEEKYKGLSGEETMPDDRGMLFVWDKKVRPKMVMREMEFDLCFIFLGKDNAVLEILSADKDFDGEIIPKDSIFAVLELNKSECDNFEVGEIVEIEEAPELRIVSISIEARQNGGTLTSDQENALSIGDVKYEVKEKDVKIEKGKLQILDENGFVVDNLDGDEVVFSIKDTEELYNETVLKSKPDVRLVGKRIIEMLDIQDSVEELYVKK